MIPDYDAHPKMLQLQIKGNHHHRKGNLLQQLRTRTRKHKRVRWGIQNILPLWADFRIKESFESMGEAEH